MNGIPEEKGMKELLNYLTARSLVIATISFLYIMVYRLTVCAFYHIPVNFESMDIKTILPVVLVALVIFCFSYIENINMYYGGLKITDSDVIREILAKLLSKILKEDIRTIDVKKIKKNNKVMVEISITEKFQNLKLPEKFLIIQILLATWGLIVLALGMMILDTYHGDTIPAIFLLLTFVIFILSGFLIKICLELFDKGGKRIFAENIVDKKESEIESEEDEKTDPLEKTKQVFNRSIPFLYLIILFVTLAVEFFVCSSFIYFNRNYKMVVDSGKSYIIIAEDENYHLVKPVSVDNDDLVIELDQYMYIDKDRALVSGARYDNIIRHSDIAGR